MFIVVADLPQDRSKWLPHKVGVEVTFPQQLTHEGQEYWHTTKSGVNFQSGLPAGEYENDEKQRVWLLVTGDIVPE